MCSKVSIWVFMCVIKIFLGIAWKMGWLFLHWIIWLPRMMVMLFTPIRVLMWVNVTILVSMSMQYWFWLGSIGWSFIRILVVPVCIWMSMGHDIAMLILVTVSNWIVWITFVMTRYDHFRSF